ncbi:MAG TPA: phosphodiester glycosidase family protein, partial [Candidatus Obscuribacterales bacterium]
PILIKNGKMFVDLKGEKFNRAWTGSHIKARTAAGVTWKNHLLLVTVEGPHTLWDLTKFLHKLGAADAMNLDGGGSTTMVVKGRTVTRNGNSYQRRVANALAVVPSRPVVSGSTASASAAWQNRHVSSVSRFEELVPAAASGAPPESGRAVQAPGLAPDVISSSSPSPENVESLVDTP